MSKDKNTIRAERMVRDIRAKLDSGEGDVVKSQINESFRILVKEQTENIHNIPESVFKTVFLPYFSGESKLPINENIIANWIGIAGSPYAEVGVIDEQGNVLFRVPGMFDSGNIDPTKRNPIGNMDSICREYQLRSLHIPKLAERFADGVALAQEKVIGDTDTRTPAANRWTEILSRYNKAGSTATPSTVTKVEDIDDLEY